MLFRSNNDADMVLGEAAVGIYASGNNNITNNGNITVGATTVPGGNHANVAEHKNSVGIYLASGSKAVNTAGTIITVNHDHSLGVFGTGAGTEFTNNGIMNIDNGGIGVLVRDGAIAINNGTINLGGTLAACEASTVGMAAYAGGTIINNFVINVTEGVGMLLSVGSELVNDGTINVVNGTGIEDVPEVSSAFPVPVTYMFPLFTTFPLPSIPVPLTTLIVPSFTSSEPTLKSIPTPDRKSTRLNSSHIIPSRMPSSA